MKRKMIEVLFRKYGKTDQSGVFYPEDMLKVNRVGLICYLKIG